MKKTNNEDTVNMVLECQYCEAAIRRMARIVEMLSSMSEQDRVDYISSVLTLEEIYLLHDVYGFDIDLTAGHIVRCHSWANNGYTEHEDVDYEYGT